jgi:succinate-semialdehyde dehydrogenase/glutarate-semialdehyde dehydrogenase
MKHFSLGLKRQLTCIGANRIFVHEAVKEPFLKAVTKAVTALCVG